MTNEQIPPELRSIAEQLDNLAEHDRSAAPDDLAQQVFARTRPSITDTVDAPETLPFPHILKHWRLAALLAVAAGATIFVTWTVTPTSKTHQGDGAALAEIESEINDFLSITASWEAFDAISADAAGDLSSDFWGMDEDDELFSEDTL